MPSDLLKNKSLAEEYLRRTPAKMAAFSFANIFIWQDFFRFDFEEVDGNLCVYAGDDAGTFIYLPPLGEVISPVAVKHCFERMTQLNKGKSISRIENVSEEQLKYFPVSAYDVYRKSYEYLYYRADLVDLKGDAYKSKRHDLNHFAKSYKAVYRPYEKNMAKECRELYKSWAAVKRSTLKEDIDIAMLEDNEAVHRCVLAFSDALGLVGRVVELEGRIVAYTFGYFLGEETFCDLVEITDTQYTGLGAYIFHELCCDAAVAKTKFINVMDDFALENVNRTKMSYRPTLMLPSYNISLRQN